MGENFQTFSRIIWYLLIFKPTLAIFSILLDKFLLVQMVRYFKNNQAIWSHCFLIILLRLKNVIQNRVRSPFYPYLFVCLSILFKPLQCDLISHSHSPRLKKLSAAWRKTTNAFVTHFLRMVLRRATLPANIKKSQSTEPLANHSRICTLVQADAKVMLRKSYVMSL